MSIAVALHEGLVGRVRLGVITLTGVHVNPADDALQAAVDALGADLRSRHAQGLSSAVPGVDEARALYKSLGLDPTKNRPSNEALLRRVLKGDALYRINTLVDALNLCSLREQIPFGLYDLEHVRPPVTLRLGEAGAGYEGIRKSWVNVEDRPTLVDAVGPFGNPTSDSARTCIRLETKDALVIAYAPARMARTRLESVLDATAATLKLYCGGQDVARSFVPEF
jgi:DNA/RNA-binding domain of Phe-tRNA-synthetase-like protein